MYTPMRREWRRSPICGRARPCPHGLPTLRRAGSRCALPKRPRRTASVPSARAAHPQRWRGGRPLQRADQAAFGLSPSQGLFQSCLRDRIDPYEGCRPWSARAVDGPPRRHRQLPPRPVGPPPRRRAERRCRTPRATPSTPAQRCRHATAAPAPARMRRWLCVRPRGRRRAGRPWRRLSWPPPLTAVRRRHNRPTGGGCSTERFGGHAPHATPRPAG